jgi:tetratricopeptide (TPR) repeat protein
LKTRVKILEYLLCAIVLSLARPIVSDDQGRHQADPITEGLGRVHFPVSCASSVQKPFERGVALLHSFWYEEAEKQFLQVAKEDPQCGMAHWGVAMSLWHQLWDQPNAKVISRGMDEVRGAKKKKITARESAYITAISAFYSDPDKLNHDARAKAYSDAMKEVYASYPDDHEAAAFYALSLLAAEPRNDKDFVNRKRAAAVLEKLFALEPSHPGVAHYLIHSYDVPQLAELGIPAARRYAKIAPAAPHALHMPSHIFASVGLWQEDIRSNLASIAATRTSTEMHMGGEGHQFHAMNFLVYAYLQSGREDEAQRVIQEVKSMPSRQDMYGMGYDPRAFALTHFEASYVLELHHWTEAAVLPLVPSPEPEIHATTHLARAIGAARIGHLSEARTDMAEIDAIAKALLEKGRKTEADFVEGQRQEALAWIEHGEGNDDEAIKLMRSLADKETQGMIDAGTLPLHELLADMLLGAKRPQEALVEYQADLSLNPNRFNGLYGAARAAGVLSRQSEATQYYRLLLKACDGSNSTRPELTKAKQLLAEK